MSHGKGYDTIGNDYMIGADVRPKPERTGETLEALADTLYDPWDHASKEHQREERTEAMRLALDRAAEIAREKRGMDGPHRSQLDCGWDMACDAIADAIRAFKEGR